MSRTDAVAARFAAVIARATGVRLAPTTRPDVINGAIVLWAPALDGATIAAALIGVHGVDRDGVTVEYVDEECLLLPSIDGAAEALVRISLDALAERLATLTAVRS